MVKKCYNNAELNTKNVSVGNWLNEGKGEHRFVEVGEGVIEDQSTTVHQEEGNDPGPINDEVEENNPVGNANNNGVQPNNYNNNTTSTVTTSVRISRQPA